MLAAWVASGANITPHVCIFTFLLLSPQPKQCLTPGGAPAVFTDNGHCICGPCSVCWQHAGICSSCYPYHWLSFVVLMLLPFKPCLLASECNAGHPQHDVPNILSGCIASSPAPCLPRLFLPLSLKNSSVYFYTLEGVCRPLSVHATTLWCICIVICICTLCTRCTEEGQLPGSGTPPSDGIRKPNIPRPQYRRGKGLKECRGPHGESCILCTQLLVPKILQCNAER